MDKLYNITKRKAKSVDQGFIYVFNMYVNGKYKYIKSSTDLDKLIEYRDNWFKENHYVVF